GIRLVEELQGAGEITAQPCEEGNRASVRRSIAAGAELPAGHLLALSDLTWIRPSGGLPPGDEAVLIGHRLKKAVSFGTQLTQSDVE
ncbi:MAG: SAF domain-containing protein, partial [Verrucomicrobia bacterium]|nr:SAF domain-containing protein [Verrucomicrobiota bacterium]